MAGLWGIVSGAPWWVYVLLIVLVRLGIKAMRPRTLPIKSLHILPIVFLAWSLYSLYTKLASEDAPSLIIGWVIALIIGACLGIAEVYKWRISVDRRKKTITIPGNYSTLVLILLIFVIRFFWGYWYATHVPSFQIYLWDTASSAVLTGFFVGRAASFFRRYLKK